MGLQKGSTNNPAGRPKGRQNKLTADLRDQITSFLQSNWKQFEKNFNKLEAEKKLFLFEKLLKYSLPQLRQTSLNIDIDSFSENQLNQIISEIMHKDEKNENN